MAINKILNPSSTPTAVSDYQAQNNIIAALLLKTGLSAIVSGSNIVSGAVFNLGGSTYKADADTAITGSASDYVKITPSGATASASYVSSLTGVSWNAGYQGYYDGSGNLYIFDEFKAYKAGVIADYHFEDTKLLVAHSNSGEQLFTANGSWKCPPGVTKAWLSGVAPGGDGGDGGNNSGLAAGGGGAGGGQGEACFEREVTVVPGTTYAVTIGTPGSDTTFGALLTLTHGPKGQNGTNASGSTPGVGGVGVKGGGDAGKNGFGPLAGTAPNSNNSTGGGGAESPIDKRYNGSGNGSNFSTAPTDATAFGAGGGGGTGELIGSGGERAGSSGGPSFLKVRW